MSASIVAGRYRLDELLGQSGMSDVWRAQDLVLSRPVALKLLAPGSDPARFEREARALASLAHPNIGRLYDYGETGDRPFLVLEYLPGGTLEQRLSTELPVPDGEARVIAAGMAAGLEHAHARGVVHRDLKPANVLFDEEGRPKLVDFGIARSAQHEVSITDPGTVLGTAAYMAPEQASGERVGPSADVYAFGAILYRMLTGRPPFVSKDPLELVRLHQTAEPPPISAFRTDPPPDLASTAVAALAKDPASRPRDGAALLGLLGVAGATPLADMGPAGAEPTLVLERAPRAGRPPPPRGGKRLLLALAALLVLGLGGALLAYTVTRTTGAPTHPASTPPATGTSLSGPGSPSTPTRPTSSTSTPSPTGSTPSTPSTSTTKPTTTPTTAPPTTAPPTTVPPTTTATTTTPTTTPPTTTTAQTTTGQTTTGQTTTPTGT
jgi:serine/threonine-protein kinase